MAVVSVGVPSEVKDGERRVVLDPHAVNSLTSVGRRVLVQRGAGEGAGFADEAYRRAGADLVADRETAWSADIIVKVKEPQPEEWAFLRPGLTLFAYLHLAAEPDLARVLVDSRVEAYAFETLVQGGSLPLLAPMSEVAGRASAIIGAAQLAAGEGTLLGGAAGVPPARVVVLGMGVAGTMAARGARGMDAEVTGVDVDLTRLMQVQALGVVTSTLASSVAAVGEAVVNADLVIGAALIPGARAPLVLGKHHVEAMRPGSVVVDLAIDQGGCVETARPTSLSSPTFVHSGVIHYCVTNVPGQYPRTASRALSAAVAPRLVRLAHDPADPSLDGALNVSQGRVVHPVVAAALAAAASSQEGTV